MNNSKSELDTFISPSQERRRLSQTLISSTSESETAFKARRRSSITKEETNESDFTTGSEKRRRVSIITELFARSSTSSSFMEKQVRPTVIMAMLHFKDSNPDIQILRRVLGKRLLEIPRFSSVFRMENDKVYCDPIANSCVDLDYHIASLDGKGSFGETELNEVITESANEWWDADKPLWQLILISNMKDGGSLLFCKIDHAIGDGVAMTSVLRSLLDDPPEGLKSFQHKRIAPPSSFRLSHRAVSFLYGCYEGIIGWMLAPKDPDNGLKIPSDKDIGDYTGITFNQTKTVPLSVIKQMKNKLQGTTVNDILMGVLTIGMRRYLEKTNDPIISKLDTGTSLRGMVVVNARDMSNHAQDVHVGNDFVVTTLKLPLSFSNEIDAVWKNKCTIDEFKISPSLYLQKRLTRAALSILPEQALIDATWETARKPSCNISNVMGPSFECTIGGYSIDDINFLASGNIGLYIGIISYADKVHLNFTALKTTNINCSLLKNCFEKAFDDLYDAVKKVPSDKIHPPDMTPFAAEVLEFFLVFGLFVAAVVYVELLLFLLFGLFVAAVVYVKLLLES